MKDKYTCTADYKLSAILVVVMVTITTGYEEYRVNPQPHHTTAMVGDTVEMDCGYSGTEIFQWREYITKPEGNVIFSTPPDRQPTNISMYAIEGQYNLVVRNPSLSFGGMYGCLEVTMKRIPKANLVILERPVIIVPELTDGAKITCSGRYGSDERFSNRIKMELYINGTRQDYPVIHKSVKTGPPGEYVPGELITSFAYTLADIGDTVTCEVSTNDPHFTTQTTLVIGEPNTHEILQIHPIKSKYQINDNINCSTMQWNPDLQYMWVSIRSGDPKRDVIVLSNVLDVTQAMIGQNVWKCQATYGIVTRLQFVYEFEVESPVPDCGCENAGSAGSLHSRDVTAWIIAVAVCTMVMLVTTGI